MNLLVAVVPGILFLVICRIAEWNLVEAWIQVDSLCLRSCSQRAYNYHRNEQRQHPRNICLWMTKANQDEESFSRGSSAVSKDVPVFEENKDVKAPEFVTSPVLRQVYPQLLQYQKLHGHVNIPLGSTAGRQCQTLRRLQLQQKLTNEEVELLTQLQFRFATLDDIYFQVPFDEMFERLLDYERKHPGTGFQIPKKYPSDPELGAWVTGIRRLAPHLTDNEKNDETDSGLSRKISLDHVERLNAIGFTWISERKCGSKFMQFYRELQQRIQDETEQERRASNVVDGDEVQEENHNFIARIRVLKDPIVQAWIAAQRDTFHRGTMSETRQHYMTSLVGDESWKNK